ncbi:Cholesterol 24-hydroxylase [Grifola frondosa]|uniref:Cholesterol 24-hydroxylase n=1 Tax=Grifola frondosa TaxID=5627 RepID=A0A1C7LYR4_GRIFR|nr:Cholesterol 24-hydroxylase [Grifola frondosa]
MAINSQYTFVLSLIVAGLSFAFALWKIYSTLLRPYRTSLRNLPGPPSPSWLFGNLKEIWNDESSVLHEEWVKQYGPNIIYRGFGNMDTLCTMDTRALNHILTHSNEYQKPEHARGNLARILGKAQIRELTEIFVEKAIQASAAQGVLLCDLSFVQLRDVWRAEIDKQGEPARIEVLSWLGKMTLDVIGLAGFNYTFDALDVTKKPNELTLAFQEIFNSSMEMSFYNILRTFLPILRILPNKRAQRTDDAQRVMRTIGKQLIEEKKAAVMKELAAEKADGVVERKDLQAATCSHC